uniref:Uncharacterized protein n=1 Tax=Arundo donax TaxID=35708 RepID=A0A0A9AI02_ARUDO
MSTSFFEGRPFLGLAQFLVMNSRVLKRMSIKSRRCADDQDDGAEHGALLETIRSELHRWPRASPDVLVKLCPADRIP